MGVSTLSNMNISETHGPITIKFYLKHYWDRGKTALGFQIRSEVWVPFQHLGFNGENDGFHCFFLASFDRIRLILASNNDIHRRVGDQDLQS